MSNARKRMRRRIRRLPAIAGALLLGVLTVAGCGENTPTAEKLTEIRLAYVPTAGALPVHAADVKGIFKRNGLRVTRTEGQDIAVFTAGVAHGQYDIATSLTTLVLVGAERGLDIQVISGVQRASAERPNSVWITKDDSIRSLGQLKGKRIGVPASTGVISDCLLYLLQKHGVDRDEIKLIPMPFPAMGDQLKAGRVDAVVANNPFSAAIAARGFTLHEDVVVEAAKEASGGDVTTGIAGVDITTRTFARENPDVIRAWRKSLTEAIRYLIAHEAEARQMLQTWLKMPPPVAQSMELPNWRVDAVVTPEELRPYVTIAKAVGTIKTEPDVDALVWQDGP